MPVSVNNRVSQSLFVILFGVAGGLIVIGVGTLWLVSWLRHVAWPTMPQWLEQSLSIIGFTAMLVGIYLLIPLLVGPYCLFVWPILTLVLLSTAVQHVRSEARELVSMLAVAARRKIPLTAVANAFAAERNGIVASRAARLADYLNAAVPLSLALRRSGAGLGLFPAEVTLAAEVGAHTGTLDTCLTNALDQLDDLDEIRSTAWANILYIVGIVLFAISILTFVMIKIMPTFMAIFASFHVTLPMATRLLNAMADSVLLYWYVAAPLFVVVGLITLVSMLSYVGVPLRTLPLLQNFRASLDNGAVMRMLALSIRGKRSAVDSLHLLAGYFPTAGRQRRLDQAAHRTRQGIPWYEAMRSAHLIKRREMAVLQSAERVGNLPWALDALGKSKMRSWIARVRSVTAILFPVLVLIVGAGIMFIVVALISPLFTLIWFLS